MVGAVHLIDSIIDAPALIALSGPDGADASGSINLRVERCTAFGAIRSPSATIVDSVVPDPVTGLFSDAAHVHIPRQRIYGRPDFSSPAWTLLEDLASDRSTDVPLGAFSASSAGARLARLEQRLIDHLPLGTEVVVHLV